MVDYDAAVAAVQDPNADPILLAKIAYENPEFGANVAVNPRCYPGLKRWIAEFGDDRARETLAQYGFTAEAFGGPVQDQKATAQAAQQPAAPAANGRTVLISGGDRGIGAAGASSPPTNRLSSPRLRRHSRSLWPPILTVSPPNRP